VLISVSILAAIVTVTFLCFSAATTAWKKGQKLSDNLHHGDFIIEQVVMGLRSAYFPEGSAVRGTYGFWNEDGGEGEGAQDWISWVKLGRALVGDDCPFAGTPHRVKLALANDDDGKTRVAVTAWRLHGQPDDFDPAEIEPTYLPANVRGFNCRAAYRKVDGVIEWLDVWEQTNRLPTLVELTFYLEPLEEGEQPVEVKRLVRIPLGVLSWK